ncbi:MAG: hypothetical protein ACI4UK_07415 [Floccifex sp.]
MNKRKIINQIKVCIDKSQYAEGIKIANKAIGIMPDSPIVHNLMGVLLERQNHHVQAIQQYKAACKLDMSYEPAHHNLERYGIFFPLHNGVYEKEKISL